ncbi:MAG: P-type conjugative transfer protein VirB9 [Glaciimonas sp.]|nr:P-type conjugative transfer protein VirB9 [Glaciimonas sp.]
MTLKNWFLVALFVPIISLAEITPPQGDFDTRVRVVDYNPRNVVKLVTFFGVSTHVQFADDETIVDVAVGDDLAWVIKPRINHLFIKPKAVNADTNLTVITNLRTYQFALVVQPRSIKDQLAWSDGSLIFSLKFHYPDSEREVLANESRKTVLKQKLAEVKTKLLDATKVGQNFDYWVAGSEEISPTAARDDGRFMFLTFSGNRDTPAIFSVDDAGHESIINSNVVDGNTIVIQRMFSKLMLRKGDLVASVVNKSFDLNSGLDNSSGTVSPQVERVIKGAL